jgi:hypothetical protein
MLTANIDRYRLYVIDFLSIVSDCEMQIMRDLDSYGLRNELNLNKKNVQIVYYFYIFKAVCDAVINSKSDNKCMFFYNEECVSEYDLTSCKLSSDQMFGKFISRAVNKFNNILPLLFYKTTVLCFDKISDFTSDGDVRDVILSMSEFNDKKKNKPYSFERLNKFIKTYNLTYMSQEYFNKVKVKALLYK